MITSTDASTRESGKETNSMGMEPTLVMAKSSTRGSSVMVRSKVMEIS